MPDTRIQNEITEQNTKAMAALAQRPQPLDTATERLTGKLEQAANVLEEISKGRRISPEEYQRLRAYLLDPERYRTTVIVQFLEER